MKILQINKFWYRHGGADAYAINLSKMLKEKGHKMVYFGMKNNENEKHIDQTHFAKMKKIAKKDYKKIGNLIEKIKNAGSIIYSPDSAKKLSQLLKKEKPDIAHLHNIYHHLSPSILGVLKRYKIPVVQTLHDYKRLCPNHALFTQGKICERCKSRRYWNAIKYKCIFNSTIPSAVVTTEMSVQSLFGWYDKYIDRFITPSRFMKKKLGEWGRRVDNVEVIPYWVDIQEKTKIGKNILYAGRLSNEKGLEIVMKIAKELKEVNFDIAGDGELKSKLEKQKLKNVKFHGICSPKKLQNLRKKSAFSLVPSKWYENYPITLLEQFATGRTVIGSNLGGIPEIINDGKNGFVIDFEDTKKWIDKSRKLWESKALTRKFGDNARKQIKKENDRQSHYKKIINIYKKTIKQQN